jgi:hypothetical protein
MNVALLDQYLHAVRTFLPPRTDHHDILAELSSHLQIKLDEREEASGRALTEDEQAEVLTAYGTPLAVAERYGPRKVGLAFGRELIGPEVFSLYRVVLLTQFSLTLIVVTAISAFGGSTGGPVARYLGPMSIQLILTTAVFMAIDLFRRRERSAALWNFPPIHMQTVPRWQSIAGFVTLSLVAIWWAAVPYAPFLLLGSAAGKVTLGPGWLAFYWPVLLPLLIGAAQRAITLVEPRWMALQAVTRLFTNTWAVIMVYLFLRSYPYVSAIEGAELLARRINNAMWWNAMTSFGLWWLINAIFSAWQCWCHAKRSIRRRREEQLMGQAVQS